MAQKWYYGSNKVAFNMKYECEFFAGALLFVWLRKLPALIAKSRKLRCDGSYSVRWVLACLWPSQLPSFSTALTQPGSSKTDLTTVCSSTAGSHSTEIWWRPPKYSGLTVRADWSSVTRWFIQLIRRSATLWRLNGAQLVLRSPKCVVTAAVKAWQANQRDYFYYCGQTECSKTN